MVHTSFGMCRTQCHPWFYIRLMPFVAPPVHCNSTSIDFAKCLGWWIIYATSLRSPCTFWNTKYIPVSIYDTRQVLYKQLWQTQLWHNQLRHQQTLQTNSCDISITRSRSITCWKKAVLPYIELTMWSKTLTLNTMRWAPKVSSTLLIFLAGVKIEKALAMQWKPTVFPFTLVLPTGIPTDDTLVDRRPSASCK